MIKIKIKTLLICLILLIGLMPLALASNLEINKLKAYVDGDKDSGTTIDVDPESELEIKFEIENTYGSDGLEIEDIEVTSYIEGIDDDDDLDPEEDPDVDNLDTGDDDSVELVFEIPLEVDDETYDLEIKVEGKDTNGTIHTVSDTTLSVRVKKEKHDVAIRKAELYNPNLKCSRSTQLSVSVINMGTSDEDDVVLTVTNEDLELSKRDTFDLDNDPFDSDSKYSTTFSLTVDKEQEAGTYPVNVKVSYDDGDKTTEKNVELFVEDCEKEEEEEETTTVVQQTTTTTLPPVTGDVVVAEPEEGAFASLQSAIGNKGVFALIFLVELAIIVVGIILVVSWVKRK